GGEGAVVDRAAVVAGSSCRVRSDAVRQDRDELLVLRVRRAGRRDDRDAEQRGFDGLHGALLNQAWKLSVFARLVRARVRPDRVQPICYRRRARGFVNGATIARSMRKRPQSELLFPDLPESGEAVRLDDQKEDDEPAE